MEKKIPIEEAMDILKEIGMNVNQEDAELIYLILLE